MKKAVVDNGFPGTPDDESPRWRLWQVEYELLEGLLQRVEAAERAILTAIRCPIDPVSIYDIVTGARKAPWPARTTARAKARAKYAMYTLLLIGDVRRYASLTHENAPLAAFAALRVGLLAGDAPLRAVSAATARPGQKKGGTVTGKQIAAGAAIRAGELKRLQRRWEQSEVLQLQYSTAVKYIRAQTNLSKATIYRRLKTKKSQ